MMKALKAGIILVFLGLVPAASAALKIPAQPEGYVTDRASILAPEVRSRLETRLRDFEKQTSSQILVATFQTLEGESLEDFSMRIAEAWKAGQQEKDNGVLLLIFREDRKIRIEVGYGLEGVLTDALSAAIIRDIITPQFKAGNFDRGIEEGVNAITKTVRGEYTAPTHDLPKEETGGLVHAILIVLLIAGALDVFRYLFYWSGHRSYSGRYGIWEWFFLFSILWFILRLLLSSRGGYSGRSGGWNSGSGYSGGGGRFGGGGASGGW